MDLNWMESIIYGFLSGLMDILPVSSQAHRLLLMKFYGISQGMDVMRLAVHMGVFGGLYYSCQSQIVRINRARALARVPKRRRRRPLDTRSLMDWSMLKTMLIPMIAGLLLYRYNSEMRDNLLLVAIFLLVNGIILYVPQFLPGSNRDSRTLTRLEGFLMGLGATAAALPGISAVGAAVSIGSVCGVERGFCLSMALMMNLALNLGLAIVDVFTLFSNGLGVFSFSILVRYAATALTAFGGCLLGIKLMRFLSGNHGYSVFGFYCVGLSLFTFILNLMA